MTYTNYDWITDQLAIGGLVEEAEELPFDAILSMETFAPAAVSELATSDRVEYEWHSIMDGVSHEENDEIVRRFDAAAAQLHQWLGEGKRVLIHCTAGVSRSVTATIWYFMRYHGYSWDDALAFISERRTCANPNLRFEIPLRLAAGEDLSEEWIEQRIADHVRQVQQEYDVTIEPERVWGELERQGTVPVSSAAQH